MQSDFKIYLEVNAAYSEQAPYVLILMGAVILLTSTVACTCIVRINPLLLVIVSVYYHIHLLKLKH